MNINLSTQELADAGLSIRLIVADSISATNEQGYLAAFAKTPGALGFDSTAPGTQVLGLGKLSVKNALIAGRKFVHNLRNFEIEQVTIDCSVLLTSDEADDQSAPSQFELLRAFVRGLWLGTYQLGQWKEERIKEVLPETAITLHFANNPLPELLAQLHQALVEAHALAQGQLVAMNLVDRPANAKRPTDVAHLIEELGNKHGFQVEVLDAEALEIQQFGGILAVGRASTNPPCLVKMHYQGGDKFHLGLVGKGITFDTGGISIKNSQNMGFMKSDLGGAAAMLGTLIAVAELKLPVEITALIPLAENVIAGNAYLPSDVIRNYGGKTIEIVDTDAEGRLVMADALAYLPEISTPDVTIDIATLTGSAVQTLGYVSAALFTRNDELDLIFQDISKRVAERVWRFPLWEEYEDTLQSDVADVKHFHGLPIAGAINAAKFLEYFAADKENWIHLDIAGVAFGNSEFSKDRSATGFGVALLTEFLKVKAND